MGLASDVAGAISEGINSLCGLLIWLDAGVVDPPPHDGETLGKTMAALAEAMREVLYGGRLSGGGPTVTEENLTRVLRLEELFAEWTSKGALLPEIVPLAELCINELCGMSWRQLLAMSRR